MEDLTGCSSTTSDSSPLRLDVVEQSEIFRIGGISKRSIFVFSCKFEELSGIYCVNCCVLCLE